MSQVVALVSIEGSGSIIQPGSVFEASGDMLAHLEAARAVRPATKEDVALAKARGLAVDEEKPSKKAADDKGGKKAEGDSKADPDLAL